MKTTINAFLHYHKYEWDENPTYMLFNCDMGSCGPEYVLIGVQEVEVEIPDDFDPRPQQIEALKEAKQKILAETQIKVNNIEEQIQRILAIEYKPEVTE